MRVIRDAARRGWLKAYVEVLANRKISTPLLIIGLAVVIYNPTPGIWLTIVEVLWFAFLIWVPALMAHRSRWKRSRSESRRP